jgi:hypothetical protein
MPQLLRGLRAYTDEITAIVTVADDGGSSGRLRRQMGILPPGDFRNNIAALSPAEELMTRLFQYRFATGEVGGNNSDAKHTGTHYPLCRSLFHPGRRQRGMAGGGGGEQYQQSGWPDHACFSQA